jgi:hypothetical protein
LPLQRGQVAAGDDARALLPIASMPWPVASDGIDAIDPVVIDTESAEWQLLRTFRFARAGGCAQFQPNKYGAMLAWLLREIERANPQHPALEQLRASAPSWLELGRPAQPGLSQGGI